jgi:hypothetical protein
MKITEDYARKTIEEVAPLVEKLSGLRCNLKDYKIELKKELPKDKLMEYNSEPKSFVLINNFNDGNQDWFKVSIGHELMHNAQFSSFPELITKEKNMLEYKVIYSLLDRGIENPFKKLIEGDAKCIEKKLNKEYFRCSKLNLFGIPLIPTINIQNSIYDEWGDILNKKFNGNREEINKLYSFSCIEELIDIFGTIKIIRL